MIKAIEDQAGNAATVLVEDWSAGQKVTVAGTAARTSPAFTQGAVRVRNLTTARIWVRADDGTAADDGRSTPLDPGDADTFAVQSSDGKISLLGTGGNTGAVYVMPLQGTR